MARDFNGTTDGVKFTLAAGQTSFQAFSVAFWIYPDSVSQYGQPVNKGESYPNMDIAIEFDDGWGFIIEIGKAAGPWGAWSVSKPSASVWSHWVITMDVSLTTNDPVFYKDGVSQSVTERITPSGSASYTSTKFSLGNNYNSPAAINAYNGRMAEFGMWNRILSASEAATLAKGFSPAFLRNGLKTYIPLIGKNSPETDKIFGTRSTSIVGSSVIAHPRIIYPKGYA